MSKKISKLLLALLLVIVTVSSFSICYADVDGDKTKAVTTSENPSTDTAETTGNTTEEEIHSGDLYLFDNDIVMDKLVDGNVFIFGSNVEITGQVNGNLFVCANSIKFNESYVRYTIFACGNSVYYNGICNDLYVAANNLETTYDSIAYRDIKVTSSDVIFRAAVGRDVDLYCERVDFGEGENIPIVYGNLRYNSNNEVEIPEGVISGEGTATYTKPDILSTESISDILIGFATCIVTALVIFAITKKCTPKFAEKLSNEKLSILKVLKAFGIGLASFIIVSVAFILLLITVIGAKLSILLVLLYMILCLISVPVLTIVITNILKPALKIEKTSMFCLVLSLVSIVLYGITLIPYAGGILGIVIKLVAIGLLIDMYIPHKELTDEEKVGIEEARKQAKEDKEKRKQERLEAKEAKKQAKLEAKESKKENK